MVLTTVTMTDCGKPFIGNSEKNINNNTAVHISNCS
jgi:hypothetical protein